MKKRAALIILTSLFWITQIYITVIQYFQHLVPIDYSMSFLVFSTNLITLLLILTIWNFPKKLKHSDSLKTKYFKYFFFLNIAFLISSGFYLDGGDLSFFQPLIVIIALIFISIWFSISTTLNSSFKKFYTILTISSYTLLLYSFLALIPEVITGIESEDLSLKNLLGSFLGYIPMFIYRFITGAPALIFLPFFALFFNKKQTISIDILDEDF